jgi:hypothetical protein
MTTKQQPLFLRQERARRILRLARAGHALPAIARTEKVPLELVRALIEATK